MLSRSERLHAGLDDAMIKEVIYIDGDIMVDGRTQEA